MTKDQQMFMPWDGRSEPDFVCNLFEISRKWQFCLFLPCREKLACPLGRRVQWTRPYSGRSCWRPPWTPGSDLGRTWRRRLKWPVGLASWSRHVGRTSHDTPCLLTLPAAPYTPPQQGEDPEAPKGGDPKNIKKSFLANRLKSSFCKLN